MCIFGMYIYMYRDATRKGGGASIRLLEYNIELRHVDARFGVACSQTKATGGAWFVDHGKKKHMRSRGVKSIVRPWGEPGKPPQAVEGVVEALRDFKGREDVTYVVIYGHWFSSRRSDVSFYSKAGKPIAPGPKLYEQTTRVLSRELANGMTGNKQRTVFLGFPPIKNAKTGDVCSHDSKWSRAVQAALTGFDAERHGVFFLDLECPLARLPHSSYAYRSPGHRHLPGGPDLANAILLRFLARVNE